MLPSGDKPLFKRFFLFFRFPLSFVPLDLVPFDFVLLGFVALSFEPIS